jgi:CHAT domain-containing protein
VCNLTVGQMRDTWLTKEKIEYVGRYSPKEEDNLRILANDDNDYQPYKHPKYWAAFICLGLAD